jgi:outer membrane protein TolC
MISNKNYTPFIVLFLVTIALLTGGCPSQKKVARQIQANRQTSLNILQNGSSEQEIYKLETISGDITIEDCLELALIHNKDVQTAKLKLLEAKGQMTEAVATALPNVGFTGSALRNDNSGFINQKETYDLQLLARQPLYLGGLIGTALDAAAVFTYLKQQELRQTFQNVHLEVRQKYIAALLVKQLVEAALLAQKDAQKLLADTEKKLRYGSTTRFEVLRAQVRLNAIEADLIRRENEAQISLTRLLNVMGVSQSSKVELVDSLKYDFIDAEEAQCLSQAILQRPDLLMGEAGVRLAKDNLEAEKAGNRPKVYLQGTYQRSYPGFSASFDDFLSGSPEEEEEQDTTNGPPAGSTGGKEWERTMSGGIVVEWPFFDGFATTGRVMKAKAQLRQEEVLLKKAEEQVQLEVTQSLLRLNNSQKFVESQMGTVTNAEEALRLAQVGFREGTITSLDVISAELALSQARSDYYQAVHDYELSKLLLNAAIGTIGENSIPTIAKDSDPNTALTEQEN